MFSSQLAALQGLLDQIADATDSLTQILDFAQSYRDSDGKRFDELGVVPGLAGNFIESIIYTQQALETFGSLKFDKNKIVPNNIWPNAISQISEIKTASKDVSSQVAAAKGDARRLRCSNGSVLTEVDTGGVAFDLTVNITRLANSTDGLLATVAALYGASKAGVGAKTTKEGKIASDDAAAAAAALAKAEEAARQAKETSDQLKASLEALTTASAAITSSMGDLVASLNGANSEAQSTLEAIRTAAATATDGSNNVSSRASEIAQIKAQADSTAASLSAYDSALEKTKAEVEAVKRTAQDIVQTFDTQRGLINDRIEESEKMLKGATVSGLASAFAGERDSLDLAMKGAFWQFCFGIVGIVLATILFAIFIFNIPIVLFGMNLAHPFSENRPTGQAAVTEALSRLVLIIGPFWFTRFATARYRSLFDLRQQYSHKYNMAVSVNGFKLEAPEFSQWIATWVFSMIAESPVKSLNSSAGLAAPPPLAPKEIAEGIILRAAKLFGVDLSKLVELVGTKDAGASPDDKG